MRSTRQPIPGCRYLTGEEYVRYNGANPIAHGGILFGLASKVLGKKMPGFGTIYFSQLVNFLAPVFINDTVTCVATITALLPKHVAKISTIVTNQSGQIVMDGVSTVKLPGSLMLQVAAAALNAA